MGPITTGLGEIYQYTLDLEEGRYLFQPIEVIIGRQQGGYTEILSGLVHQQILKKGVYNIQPK
ncbi:MAG: hypothetical protein PHZ13_07945 [bacterium]|nr:hypothetical protein [Synergistaceae bacterium]MDD2328230.1 hypothetical protein [bacterium]